MFVSQNFFVGFRDIDHNNNLKIKSALSYLEDTAGIHSNIAGYGLYDIPIKKLSWVLINWKVEFIRRPKYAENLRVKTWSNGTEKIFALRDFYIYDEKDNVVAKATSKWALIDIANKKIAKLDDKVMGAYGTEPDKVFDDKIERLKEPETYIKTMDIPVTSNMIDVNGHVHNINYIDFVSPLVPEDIMDKAKMVEVLYKKEIRGVDKVRCFYGIEDGKYYVVIKSEDESILHSIIRLSM